jgi:SAM-dependent methyltransferase
VRRSGRAGLLSIASSRLGAAEDQYDVLAQWIAEVAVPTDSLLDIGAGDGDDQYCRLVRPLVGRFEGIDPDPYLAEHRGLDAGEQTTIEDFARQFVAGGGGGGGGGGGAGEGGGGPRRGFDLALAIYVVEHVAEPVEFFRAARSCLRPGGSLFIITPNLWHYFGLVTKASMALGVEERLLTALRSAHEARLQPDGDTSSPPSGHVHGPGHGQGHSQAAAHFSLAYRANSVRALRRVGDEAGFSALEIRHLENPAVFETYFPGRAAAFPRWYSRTIHRLGRPTLFGTLICRFVN